ncbi:MAG TPA: coenzyme F420-0:L-glutamate ligase [Candidatus Nitrosotalea sp.]|nr:coenzyme F420-0:L-glutamate ligase [Candidatus Nitrosotalea sp.]
MSGYQVFAVAGLPEVAPGDDLGELIAERVELLDGDVLVVAQKVVSKAEGMVLDLGKIEPGERARELAAGLEADPRLIQLVLDQSRRVVRADRVLIVETVHGYVCANAGIDHSNVPGEDSVTLLPEDSDRSAARLCERLSERTGRRLAVVVSDTFGRPWRNGVANVALGVCGIAAAVDYRGRPDDFGRRLDATVIAVADELAAAAELAMGKTARTPVVVVRGLEIEGEPGLGRDLIRPPELDLFR